MKNPTCKRDLLDTWRSLANIIRPDSDSESPVTFRPHVIERLRSLLSLLREQIEHFPVPPVEPALSPAPLPLQNQVKVTHAVSTEQPLLVPPFEDTRLVTRQLDTSGSVDGIQGTRPPTEHTVSAADPRRDMT